MLDIWSKVKTDYEAAYGATGDRSCSKGALLDWVFTRICCDPAKIPLEELPCRGALPFLIWANSNYDAFLTLWGKRIQADVPVTPQETEAFFDDGRPTAILDELEVRFVKGSERLAGESEVSARDIGAGSVEPGSAA